MKSPLPVDAAAVRPPSRRKVLMGVAVAGAAPWLGGCATPTAPTVAAGEWHDVPLPGKRRTDYRWEQQPQGRVLVARADHSASLYRKHLARPLADADAVEFSWWAQALPVGGDISHPDSTDAAACVLFSFGGDHATLPARTQSMFELARALTGETPPYATLAYVWDVGRPVGEMVVHPRSDRVRKFIVESGPHGLGQWRRYRRSLAADYRIAFGEAPGPLLSVAVMTDGDNTRSRLLTRYRDIVWH